MASVALQNVSKSYGNVEIVRDLSLDIEDGAFTVFVGPSGCGKSTLLRMIAGLEDITQGDLVIDEKRVNDADPIERGVAMVFQNYALYPHMTVAQNIGFSLRMAGHDKKDIAARVAEAARILQIEPLLDRKPAQLSGGQRQRVAIGRAIVRSPDVFLFDEPLSNLDAELRVSMRIEIAKLHRTLGSTMIYVTHDQTEAMTLADKIVVLRAGKIEQAGSPETLYEDPDNSFVAGFIGSPRMNFFKGELDATGKASVIDGSSWQTPLQGQAGAILVGIRPEHFVQSRAGLPEIEITVDVIENLGATRYVYARLGSGGSVIVEMRDSGDLKAGDTVKVAFQPERALIFSSEGARLRPSR